MVDISIPLPESCLEPATPKGATLSRGSCRLLIVLQPLAQSKVRDIKSGYKTKFNYIRELEGQREKS